MNGFTPDADKIVNLKEKCSGGDKSVIIEEVKPEYIKDVSFKYRHFNLSVAIMLFGSFGNEPMQSCSVRRVSLSLSSSSVSSASVSSVSVSASVYSPPSDSFDHRNFISCKYMQLYP